PIVLMPISLVFGGLIFYRVKIGVMYGVEKDVANLVPFIAALAAMLIFYSTKLKKALAPPASLGKIYYREERTI
ncbi:MAG: ribose ABC transporter permease, partial [Desulfurococcaceae archaeon]